MIRKRFPSFRTMTAAAALLAFGGPALAAPEGGSVVSGQADISRSGAATTIDQSTGKAIIDWQKFSIAANETVTFNQPSASSVTLNRVIGGERSVIEGALNANGQVFLVNSAGVLMGKGASVDTAGFVASTRDIGNEDFNAGRYSFEGASEAEVINLGSIAVAEGGYVALLGRTVSNQGVIVATKGTVSLNGADKVTLNFNGDSLVSVSLDQGSLDALVENRQAIHADGGRVILTAKAADDLLGAQVNNSGIVQARTLGDLTGDIEMFAHGGTANVAGTLDASAPDGGDGGFIETSGDRVRIADSARIVTASATGENGKWLIDPVDFVVGAGGDLRGSFITNYLATQGDFEVQSTDGDIVIDDDIDWYKNTLTLTSAKNILVNGELTATGTADLVATWGEGTNDGGAYEAAPYGLYTAKTDDATFTGKINFSGSGTVTMQGEDYAVINTVEQFNAIGDATDQIEDLTKNYVLGSDIDFSGSFIQMVGISGTGAENLRYSGMFNGFGHVIKNPLISETTNQQYAVFGGNWGTISNTGIVNASLTGNSLNRGQSSLFVGLNNGIISNSFSTGSAQITVATDFGGVAGLNYGVIANSYSNINYLGDNITSLGSFGGFVGVNWGNVVNSHSHGTVTLNVTEFAVAEMKVGGFVGRNVGSIDKSYSNLPIVTNGNGYVVAGGFVGKNDTATSGAVYEGNISDSYSTGSVTGFFAGGFVGYMTAGDIANSYSTGSVTGFNKKRKVGSTIMECSAYAEHCGKSGGFAGYLDAASGSIVNTYAAGSVTGAPNGSVGGYVGTRGAGTIANAYWTENNGLSDAFATELTAEQAQDIVNYVGFDGAHWASSAEGHPILKLIPVYATANVVREYGDAYGVGDFTFSGLQWGDTAARFTVDPAVGLLSPYGRLNAGVYQAGNLLKSDAYSNVLGTVTVNPKVVAVTGAVAQDKEYDGTLAAEVTGGTMNITTGEDVTAALNSAFFASKNAGDAIAVLFDYAFAYGGVATRNYVAAGTATARIAPKTISADYTVADKVYDGTTAATVNGATLNGLIAGDAVSIMSTTAAFADRNAGNGIGVTIEGVLGGGDGGNYLLAAGNATANITPRAVRLIGSVLQDGDAQVSAADLMVANLVSGDSLTLGGSITIAGSGIGLHEALGLSGLTLDQAGSNYTLAGAGGTIWVHGPDAGSVSGPQGGTVVSGSATITQSGNVTNIHQSSDRAIIDWLRFSVPASMLVNFEQPDAGSVTLNRVIGNERSVIAGAITATGKVFIVNSAGVLFSSGSRVNTAGLVASAQSLGNAAFNSGNYAFTGVGGAVRNEGAIVIRDGGYAALLGGEVANAGSIVAHGGDILLAAGKDIAFDAADPAASTADTLAGTVDVGGVLDVSSSTGSGGSLATMGGTVTVAQAAQIRTGGAGANGRWSLVMPGSVTVGTNLRGSTLADALDSGSVLLKSLAGDIEIDDAFGWSRNTLHLDTTKNITVRNVIDVTGSGSFEASYGQSRLVNHPYGNYENLTDPQYDIELYGITMAFGRNTDGSDNDTFAGKIDFGGTGTVRMGVLGDLKDYTVIRTAAELDAIRNDSSLCSMTGCSGSTVLAGNYVLGSDIDLASHADWTPLGTSTTTFIGNFNGFGHLVSNLKSSQGGLFKNVWASTESNELRPDGTTTGNKLLKDMGVISNLGVTGADIDVVDAAIERIGTVIAQNNNTSVIRNVFATGTLSARQTTPISPNQDDYRNWGNVGGISGTLGGYVDNSYSRVDVTTVGYSRVGGFVGSFSGDVQNSYATGNVSATKSQPYIDMFVIAGGFGGRLNQGSIKDSYATGNVTGVDFVGGFLGDLIEGEVYRSHASGNVHMVDSQSYYWHAYGDAYMRVHQDTWDGAGAGGFIGRNTGLVARSFSNGRVTSESGRTDFLGGFAGYTTFFEGAFSVGNYFNKETAGLLSDGRGNLPPDEGHSHGGSGTPILDAFNERFGTNLSREEFHRGADGLTNDEFAHVGDLTSGTKSLGQVRNEFAAAAQAAAAFQQKKETAVAQATAIVGNVLSNPVAAPMSSAGTGGGNSPPVQESITFADAASYSVEIKSIEAEGVVYELEDTEAAPGASDDGEGGKRP
jgi:filamentous haemagglutinin family N-terminal domain/filamentous haemagglutinin family N-terminal domain